METNFFRNDDLTVFLIGHITEICHYSSQNEGVSLKMDSKFRESYETLILYDCRDIGGFLEVTFLWIYPIYKNLCRLQWLRVGINIDYRDNSFVYD